MQAGKARFCGVSVNRVEEGLKALEHANDASIQIVYNLFRQRPAEMLFREAKRRGVAVVGRLPLSSGLLGSDTIFAADDHRHYNRKGRDFDRGETFSGVDHETALAAVEKLKARVPGDVTMAQWAMRWILMQDAVACVIPGARRERQVEENAMAAGLAPLTPSIMVAARQIYDDDIRALVHERW